MVRKVISISKKISLPRLRNGIRLIGCHCSKQLMLDMLFLLPNITKVLHFGNQTLNPTREKMYLLEEILLVTWPKV